MTQSKHWKVYAIFSTLDLSIPNLRISAVTNLLIKSIHYVVKYENDKQKI